MGTTKFERRRDAGEPQIWSDDPEHVSCAMTVPGHDSWVVEARFDVAGRGGVQLVSLNLSPLSVLPSPPDPPLTTAVVRSVRLEPLYQWVRKFLPHSQALGIYVEPDASAFRGSKRPGRRGRPDSEYLEVAVRYVHLVRDSGSPTKLLAEELHVSQSAARDLVHEARSRGLLTATTQGVKGGELTEKALKLLATVKQND
jgi:hypothetical protein